METRVEFTGTFTACGRCLLPHSVSPGSAMMKRALPVIASVGFLAVPPGVEPANAQSYPRYGPARTYNSPAYTPQSRGSVRREGVLRTTPFADPNSPEATGGGSPGYKRALPRFLEKRRTRLRMAWSGKGRQNGR